MLCEPDSGLRRVESARSLVLRAALSRLRGEPERVAFGDGKAFKGCAARRSCTGVSLGASPQRSTPAYWRAGLRPARTVAICVEGVIQRSESVSGFILEERFEHEVFQRVGAGRSALAHRITVSRDFGVPIGRFEQCVGR
jgi:hypothetical protein